MNNAASQEQGGTVERLVIPPEELERLEGLPIFPPVSQMLLESLNRKCVKLWIPPIDVD